MRLFISTAVIVWTGAVCIGQANAQHLHQHGNHFDVHQNVQHGHDAAGHLTDSFGHHINGDGRHTGSTGVFENGSHDHGWNSYQNYPSYNTPSYFSPSYTTPNYVSPGYSSVPNGYLTPNYSTPGVLQGSSVVTSPPPANIGSSNVVNKIPIPNANQIPGMAPQQGASIELRNPRESGGMITYSLNNYSYTIKPGEVQRLQTDRNWVIKFENGLGKSVAYRLEAGNYDFTVSPQTGWDVGRRIEAQPPVSQADVPPSLPQNSIPQNSIPKNSLGNAPPPVTIGN